MHPQPDHDHVLVLPLSRIFYLALAIMWLVGIANSHPNTNGRPLLLLPDVWQTVVYREKALAWKAEFTEIEQEIEGVLSDVQTGDLLSRTQSAQKALEHAISLAKEIDQSFTPVTVATLNELLYQAALDYVESARSATRWLSLPKQEYWDQAQASLETARLSRLKLEESEWIKTP